MTERLFAAIKAAQAAAAHASNIAFAIEVLPDAETARAAAAFLRNAHEKSDVEAGRAVFGPEFDNAHNHGLILSDLLDAWADFVTIAKPIVSAKAHNIEEGRAKR